MHMYSPCMHKHLRRGMRGEAASCTSIQIWASVPLADKFTVERGTASPFPSGFAQRICFCVLHADEGSMDLDLSNRDRFMALVQPNFRALNEALKEKSIPAARRCIAMQIATNLALTHHALKSIPVYWIEPEVDKLCQTLSNNLTYMDNVRL